MKIRPAVLSPAFATLILFLAPNSSILAQETESKPPAEPKAEESAPSLKLERADAEKSAIPTLIAVLSPTEGHETRGIVTFEPLEGNKVRVTARVTGLTPDARHAIHIHEFGDLTAPDGSSAGNHFNPAGKPHGLPDSDERHVGDFGNLQADAEGVANHVLTLKDISLVGDTESILGRAVVVHAHEDKGTQPSGDAGDRIAYGVIAIANPASIQSEVASNSTGARSREPAGPGEKLERAAREVERGVERAARATGRAVEQGAKEVGGALKKVGEKIEEAAR